MLKQFSFFIFSFLLYSSAFAALNESTKPDSITVYLEQNLPYSGFNSQQKAQGLYADFWYAWSLKTGISVNLKPYLQQELHTLLASSKPAVYSAVQVSNENVKGLSKNPLLKIRSDFYHFLPKTKNLSAALNNENKRVIIGGLFPEAYQLPLFKNNNQLIYKEYPGFLELLLDLYNDQIDALVIFNIGKVQGGIIDSVLGKLLHKTEIGEQANQLFTYLPNDQQDLLKWLQWGIQFEQLDDEMRVALVNKNQPWWGTSATMTRNIFLVSVIFLVFLIIGRSKRKKDRQFKDVLDSSPYPLAILTLDGNTIFYLNDEVKSLFPFKTKNKKFIFEEAENQLLLSRFINKASHQTVIENGLVRLLVDDTFHDIELFAKRIHYKRKTAWLCHLKDVTALLRAERKLTEERELLRKVLDFYS